MATAVQGGEGGEGLRELSLLECLKGRHALRTILKKKLCYVALTTPLAKSFVRPTTLQSCSAINLVAGEHFGEHATSWRDLKREGRDLLQSIVNAHAHLSRAKSSTGPMPACESRLVVETLVNQTTVPGRAGLSFQVVGYRVWLLVASEREQFEAYLKERKKAVAQKGKGKRTRDDVDGNATGPQKAKKRRRKDDDSAVEDVAASEEHEEAADEDGGPDASDSNVFSPLAIGLGASFADARALSKRLKTARDKEEQRRAAQRAKGARAKALPATEEQPLAVQDVDVGSMMPFHYLNATSDIEFHLQAIVKYVRPRYCAFTTRAGQRPLSAGQFIDTRPFMEYSPQDEFNIGVRYADRRHVLNPDAILSKEAAMVYHTRNPADGTRRVCSRQTNLGYYMNCLPQGYESPVDEEEEGFGGRDDDQDDGAMQELMLQLEGEGTARASALPFHSKLENLRRKDIRDSANVQFPFPSLTKVLNRSMATPEGMAMLELLFPIGHVLTEKEIEHGELEKTDVEQVDMCAKTRSLAKYEEVLNEDIRRRHPNASKVGVIAALNGELRESDDHADLQTMLEMRHLAVRTLTDGEAVREILDEQVNVVQRAIHREGTRVFEDPYQSLFGQANDPVSHNECMSMSDFLPFAFVFRRDRMNLIRERVEAHLRQQFYADLDTLAPVERTNAEQQLRTQTDTLVRQIAEKEVDDVPSYFIERDDLLKQRIHNQVHKAVARYEMATKVAALRKEAPPDLRDQLVRMRNFYQINLCRMYFKAADQVLETLRTSNNIADALKSVDFRTWYQKNCTPAMMVTLGADQPVLPQDATPFNSFIQTLADYALVDLGIRASGLHLFLVTLAGGLDSQTWAHDAIEPKLNTLVSGATAVGKSLNARSVGKSMPPGITENLSNFSAQAFVTASNNDNRFIVQEESKASLVAPNEEDRKRGGSDLVNMIKDLLTRHQATSKRAIVDKDTGIAHTATSISSAHMSMLLLSNLNLTHFDINLARRFLVYIVATLQGEGSIRPEQFERLDMFRDDRRTRDSVRRVRITFAMYITLRSLIKAGVLPAPDRSQANMIVVAALRELGLQTNSTDLHRFLQFAENYQLFFAAHMICWSPYQAYYHANPDKDTAARWTGQSIIELGMPYMVEVSTPAVVFAMTALEFMVIPKYLDSFLRDLADLLHMSRLDKRMYRRIESADRGARAAYDVNYVTIEGSAHEAIVEMVASRNGMYKLRATDVFALIKKINDTLITGKNYTTESYKPDNETPLIIAQDDTSEILSFRPFEFEWARRGTKKVAVFCVNLHFLQGHFKKSVLNPMEWEDMHESPLEFKEREFTKADADAIGHVDIKDSPMARALHAVLSTSVFQKASYEPRGGLPQTCFEFATAYAPAPVKLSVQVPERPKPEEFRRGFDGIVMMLTIPRDPKRAPLVRENAHVLPPTVVEANRLRRAQQKNDEGEEEGDDEANLAFMSSTHDGDYVGQKRCLKALGYMTPLCFLRFMGHDDEEIKAFFAPQGTKRIPEAVPLGFSPLAYILERRLCKTKGYGMGEIVYPRDNIYKQVTTAMKTHRFKHTPSHLRTQADMEQVVDIDRVAKETLLGRVSFGEADDEIEEEEDRMRLFINRKLTDFVPADEVDAMDIDGRY